MSDTFELDIAVYEHKGEILKGLSRQFMRHVSVLVKIDNDNFNIYHVQGTPGIGLRYVPVKQWKDPRNETARLLSMDCISDIVIDRISEIDDVAKSIPTVTSRKWNCQNWVEELLAALADKSIISASERDLGIQKMRESVKLPFTTETLNTRALTD